MSHESLFESLTVCDTARLLRAEADDRIGALLESSMQAGKPSQCRAGCMACCHQLVMVTPMEAHAIREYLDSHPAAQEGLRERLDDWQLSMAGHTDLRTLLAELAEAGGYPEDGAGGRMEEAYWTARIPCPFLVANHCSIYAVRPFSCREHHVISEPRLCQIDLDRPEPAGTRLEYRTLAGYVGNGVYFLPDVLIPLPEALDYAAANPKEGEREAEERQVYDAAEEGHQRLSAAFRRLGFELPFG